MNQPEVNIDQINRACYDHRADFWDRFPFEKQLKGMVRQHYRRDLGNRVLDIGSGNGNVAAWLHGEGLKVLCLDPSTEMAARCRKKGLEVLQVRIQDFNTQEQFALVVAVLSLIHVPKGEFPAQIDKIASWLPSGGLFILAMIEGRTEGVEETGTPYPRFFAKYQQPDLEALTSRQFALVESCRFPGPVTYLLLALRKR